MPKAPKFADNQAETGDLPARPISPVMSRDRYANVQHGSVAQIGRRQRVPGPLSAFCSAQCLGHAETHSEALPDAELLGSALAFAVRHHKRLGHPGTAGDKNQG